MIQIARLGDGTEFRPDRKLLVAVDWVATDARLKGALALAKGLAHREGRERQAGGGEGGGEGCAQGPAEADAGAAECVSGEGTRLR